MLYPDLAILLGSHETSVRRSDAISSTDSSMSSALWCHQQIVKWTNPPFSNRPFRSSKIITVKQSSRVLNVQELLICWEALSPLYTILAHLKFSDTYLG